LVGIFLVAVIAGASVSYISSLNEKEFFLGEAENVLVITGLGSSTPVTSQVPEYLVTNLELIPGVVVCSPEVLTVGIINNRQDKIAVIRGVEPTIFASIDEPLIVEGVWFTGSPDAEQTGVMVGIKLADFLDIIVGDELVISSTMRDSPLLVKVSGIIETGTPIDEELILPRQQTKILAGLNPSTTTLIRVVFDNTQTDKYQVRQLVNAQFEVPVKITTLDGSLDDYFSGSILIKVFSYTNELVTTQEIDLDDLVSFSLPFGLYFFEVGFDPPSFSFESQRVAKFVNSSLDEPLLIYVEMYDENPYISIRASLVERDLPVVNHSLTLIDMFNGEQEAVDSDDNGLVEFITEKDKLYTLNCTWSGIQWIKTFFARENTSLNVDLSTDLVFSVNNASTLEPIVVGGVDQQVMLTLLKKEGDGNFTTIFNQQPLDDTTRSVLQLTPGSYELTLEHHNFSRDYTFQQAFTSNKDFFIGNGTFSVHVSDTNGTAAQQTSVSVVDANNALWVIETLTDGSGTANLELQAGHEYIISLSKDNFTNQFEFFFDKSSSLDEVLRQSYPLEVKIYDGGTRERLGINGTLLELVRGNETYQQLTDESGRATFYLPDEETRTLLVHQEDKEIPLNVSVKETPYLEIPLGNLVFDISTLTPTSYPLSGVTIDIFNRTTSTPVLLTGNTTDLNGHCVLRLPIGFGTSNELIITASFQGHVITWEGEYNSSYFEEIAFYFEYTRNRTFFTFIDYQGQPVGDLLVKLIPVSNDYDFSGIVTRTNVTGRIAFDDLYLGYYDLYYYWGNLRWQRIVINSTGDGDEQPLIFEIELDEITRIINESQGGIDLVVNKWPGNRQYLVADTAEFTQTFFSTTLSVITITFFSFIVIVSTVSFLTVASMVSFPIAQQVGELKILKYIGASDQQVSLAVALQFAFMALLSSVAGVIVGYLLVTSMAGLGTTNVAGVLLEPRFDPLSLIAIVISACVTVYIKTRMEVNKIIKSS
jgi:ABC-type lipoprotein release transport system permease subunit